MIGIDMGSGLLLSLPHTERPKGMLVALIGLWGSRI